MVRDALDQPMRPPPLDDDLYNAALAIPRSIWAATGTWWDETGRHAVKREANLQEVGRKVRTGFVIQGQMQPTLLSGILSGRRWDKLANNEKARLIVTFAETHPAAQWWREQRAAGLQ